ncbi:MAG: rod shape-determining protein MreD [Clostridiales Family XIII bacterium]|jgi:rod shape-determining protein MreD|nr:rod shape-determining protein MreD [Clostridiales Family XIII bacterium]
MNTMKYYIAVPVFLLMFLIQTTLLHRFPIFSYSPNLLLCFVVVFSFLYEKPYGLILGIVFGAMLDVATSWYFGVQTVTFVVVYGVISAFRRIFNHEKLLPDVLMAAIATPLNCFFVWGVYRLCGSPSDVMNAVRALPVLLVTQCVLTGILHLIFVRSVIRHRKDRKAEWEVYL